MVERVDNVPADTVPTGSIKHKPATRVHNLQRVDIVPTESVKNKSATRVYVMKQKCRIMRTSFK